MNPATKAKLDKYCSPITGNADFDKLVEAKAKFDSQVERLRDGMVNSRLSEVLAIATSPSVYGKWKQAKRSERKANK